MSTQEFTLYTKAAKLLKEEISQDKEKARELLVKVGVLTRGGNLKPQFKKLCTPEKPV